MRAPSPITSTCQRSSADERLPDIVREADPKGDRVVVTINGKFLPYKTY